LQGPPVVTEKVEWNGRVWVAKVEWNGRLWVWMKVMGRRKLMAMQV